MKLTKAVAAGALGLALVVSGGVAVAAAATPDPTPTPSPTAPGPTAPDPLASTPGQPGPGYGFGRGGMMRGGPGDPDDCPFYNSPEMQAWRDGREARQEKMRELYGDDWTPPRDGTGPFHGQSPRARAATGTVQS